ncbi:unnamed protein product [Bemisia tabaci]|uniref:RRM domain-containing protein n=1 Tax=Bemisia tabaci TaxID=7038 RepID=A0A9P0AFT2_BEMTA|nr:PREDICTED: RNA-binding protein 1-like isoform X1 [Bemisia tabaci]XP_018897914.1 PREDICTED: RNA-binding protein 1-like isoform X1 [Bemisia tabaci]CAH0390861.1 unnamed protein product [Bemisia tabaci]
MSHREWDIECKVYIGNLGNNANKNELEDAFSKYGPIRNIWIARNPPGFAFIEFEDPRDAEDAVRGLDRTRCCGSRIIVEMSNGRSRFRGGGPPRRRSPVYRRLYYLFVQLSKKLQSTTTTTYNIHHLHHSLLALPT